MCTCTPACKTCARGLSYIIYKDPSQYLQFPKQLSHLHHSKLNSHTAPAHPLHPWLSHFPYTFLLFQSDAMCALLCNSSSRRWADGSHPTGHHPLVGHSLGCPSLGCFSFSLSVGCWALHPFWNVSIYYPFIGIGSCRLLVHSSGCSSDITCNGFSTLYTNQMYNLPL